MHSVLRSTNLKTVKLTKTMKQTALFSESHSANSCSGEQTQQQPNNIKTVFLQFSPFSFLPPL